MSFSICQELLKLETKLTSLSSLGVNTVKSVIEESVDVQTDEESVLRFSVVLYVFDFNYRKTERGLEKISYHC